MSTLTGTREKPGKYVNRTGKCDFLFEILTKKQPENVISVQEV